MMSIDGMNIRIEILGLILVTMESSMAMSQSEVFFAALTMIPYDIKLPTS